MSNLQSSVTLSDEDLVAYGSVLDELRVELEHRAALMREGADIPSGGISFGKRVGEGTNIAIQRFEDVTIHGQVVHQLTAVGRAIDHLGRRHLRDLPGLQPADCDRPPRRDPLGSHLRVLRLNPTDDIRVERQNNRMNKRTL